MARAPWRDKAQTVIFEADTPTGKLFDVLLLLAILASVTVVMLESVASIRLAIGPQLRVLEVVLTVGFTIEYILRLATTDKPAAYALSFFGFIDLLSIVPSFVSFFIPGAQGLLVIRAFRLLRVFRVLKLVHFLTEASQLAHSIRSSLGKITVFLGVVCILVTIVGSLMYLIEGEPNGFTSIPRGVYWAVVTMTTVGYGDIAPQTILGQGIATLLMISGYAMIAVPTGIISVGMSGSKHDTPPAPSRTCPSCNSSNHGPSAKFCAACGTGLSAG